MPVCRALIVLVVLLALVPLSAQTTPLHEVQASLAAIKAAAQEILDHNARLKAKSKMPDWVITPVAQTVANANYALVKAEQIVVPGGGTTPPPPVTPDPPVPPVTAPPGNGLATAADLTYRGAFRQPAGQVWEYSSGGLAYRASSNSLFAMFYLFGSNLTEISIPTPVISTTWSTLPTATALQPVRSAFEGRLAELVPGYGGGQLVGSGVSLLGTSGTILGLSGFSYYDAAYRAEYSHFTRPAALGTTLSQGPMTVSYPLNTAMGAGPMAKIPVAWQAAFGGRDMLGGLGPAPIITRACTGPCAWAWKSSDMIAGVTPVPSAPAVYYTVDHPTLGPYGGPCSPEVAYCTVSNLAGIAFLEDTNTVLFVGTKGTGNYCYGEGTSNKALVGQPTGDGSIYCYDPLNTSKGEHAYPLEAWGWWYNAADLAKAVRGEVAPWSVLPYAQSALPGLSGVYMQPALWGLGYDAPGKRLIMVGYVGATGAAANPTFHVFTHPAK